MIEPLPPHIVAGADQELAESNHDIDQLIATWHAAQPVYDRLGLDHMTRIASFAFEYTLRTPYYATVISIAVERLARRADEVTHG